MAKTYKWLIVIILFSLLAVAALQSYLIYGDFINKTETLKKEVNTAFNKATAAEKGMRNEMLTSYFRELLTDTSKIEITAKYSQKDQRNIYSIRDKDAESPYTSISFEKDKSPKDLPDSMKIKIGTALIIESQISDVENRRVYYYTKRIGDRIHRFSDSLTVDTLILENNFRSQLDKRDITAGFSLKISDEKSEEYSPGVINTVQIPVGIRVEKPYVSAILENPFYDVLSKVRLTLIITVLILTLTATCFFVMLKIIFRQKKLSQMRDDFIANVTHELQTPVSTVMAALESLEKFDVLEDREKTIKYLAVSRQEVSRLSQMIDGVLQSSIENNDGLQLKFEARELIGFISEVITTYDVKSREQILIDFQHDCKSVYANIDRLHFRNLLHNLIDNSIKYNDKVEKQLRINCVYIDNKLKLTFSDNGPGIRNQYQDHIFEKFYRIPNKDIHDVKGHGLGLYYAKNIVSLHNGSIRVKPDNGNGTVFEIILPADASEKKK